MATMPAVWRNTEEPETPRPARDPYQLRALPLEDVFFYSKKIDNSRLVREADPQARGACWSAIGAACMVLLIVTSASAPYVASTLAGYKLEALRTEERRLLDERRNLDLEEAELLSPDRLDQIARDK